VAAWSSKRSGQRQEPADHIDVGHVTGFNVAHEIPLHQTVEVPREPAANVTMAQQVRLGVAVLS
jgi:hypothetical protein